MKKVFTWYNTLLEKELLDFSEEEKSEEEPEEKTEEKPVADEQKADAGDKE